MHCKGWSRLIGTSGGVFVGLTVQPVQAWKKGRYKPLDLILLICFRNIIYNKINVLITFSQMMASQVSFN